MTDIPGVPRRQHAKLVLTTSLAMISRAVSRPTVAAAAGALRVSAPAAGFHASATAQASLRELEQRVKSVKNIEKITKSMKMIAATRLGRAQRAMNAAKKYGAASQEIFKEAEAKPTEDGKELFIVASSDKGLCGGIHSSLSKYSRNYLSKNTDVDVVVLGEKSKSQLQRAVPQNIKLSFNQIGKAIPTYAEATEIADTILKSGIEFDRVTIVYNKFVSSMSFETTGLPVFGEKALVEAAKFSQYEMEEDVTKDLAQFALTNAIFATLTEGHASEINSKRNAMDNASKNAGDMITNLNLLYNRGRQAAITNELIDIITGASSL
ncbi:atp3 gamma subunit of the F1 sector of mitochondrial F1F0 ATP synthase [Malassezia cuniculi]|uniref:ATP synthase subunit gamma n=1 Tax=Malassezia cuniculi TaxID=948313 RepID=A0AAF0EXA3_9BASI|nr:atp3 gamma subunit of the F1 sector of mitochondrial F1F0 ATP synthase [Malassezia cuniculi]